MFNRMQTITLEPPVWPDDTERGVMHALVDDVVRKAFKAPQVTEKFHRYVISVQALNATSQHRELRLSIRYKKVVLWETTLMVQHAAAE